MKRIAVIFFLFVIFSFTLKAQVYFSDQGEVNFHSETGIHGFTGTSNHLTGQIDLAKNTVDFFVDLETLDTGNGKRDRDMRETLETDKYPFAEFFGMLTSDFDSTSDDPQEVSVTGTFTLHGIEKQIEVNGMIQKNDTGLMVKAAWTLRLEDYNIKPPRLLFIKVAQEQKINFEILLKPREN